jgi:serine phosphatase RsbU (regulator of sigma subunit)
MRETSHRAEHRGQDFARRAGQAVGGARSFWERLTEGIELSELWRQFQAEARSSYGLYAREVDWAKIEEGKRWTRPFRTAWALFMAMLMKLSPARRVLLLAAVALLLTLPSFQVDTGKGRLEVVMVGILSPGVVLLFLLLALELADRVTMKRDLEIAREIQRWLVPETPPQIPGVEIAFLTRPANTVAGDYYDTIPRGTAGDSTPRESRLLLVVADVAGKSVPAALLMATFQASLRALEAAGTPFEGLVPGLNRYACENSRSGLRFITAFLAELDTATGEITYSSAGHNPALVRRGSGVVEELAVGGLPLGIETNATFPLGRTGLGSGETLLIYTDGLIEATNTEGREYGKQHLLELLAAAPAAETAQESLRRVTGSVDYFVGAAPQHDDLTCLVVRRLPGA